jgi:adenosylcobinamide-phosphate synthase
VTSSRAATIVGAVVLDLALGEPNRRLHPVVWMGTAIEKVGVLAPRGRLAELLFGVVQLTLLAGASAVAGRLAVRWLERRPPLLAALGEAWLLKTTFSLRELVAAARRVEQALDRGDLESARRAVRALVSRDPTTLDAELLASAAIESLAENTVDSVLAPLLNYTVGGLPAALAYRAVNTLDAMIGYHGEHEHSGKAAARTDDLLNLVPARLGAGLIVAAAALTGGDVAAAWRTLRTDHARTESPNAGWPMSAIAGALGVSLRKPGAYHLGAPLPRPDLAAIDHAVHVCRAAVALGLGALVFPYRLLGLCQRHGPHQLFRPHRSIRGDRG